MFINGVRIIMYHQCLKGARNTAIRTVARYCHNFLFYFLFILFKFHPGENQGTGENLFTTVQITFIFIDFRVCDFAFAFKTQNAPCVSRFKRVLFSDRFQFAF